MLHYIVLIIFIPSFTISVPYGTISQAELISIHSVNIWLYNQSSSSQCMCQAFQYESPSIVAFNYFFNNQTCQLVTNLFSSLTTFYIVSSSNSTIFILNITFTYQTKSRCCADILWLMNKIQQSNTFRSTGISAPVGLALDTDFNMLITVRGNSSTRWIQQKQLTGNMTGGYSPFTKGNAQPISYNQGFYYVGINRTGFNPPSNYLYAYDRNLSVINNMSLPQGSPQRAVWLYNDSIMCVIIQNGLNSSIAFLNWYSTPSYFTYNRTVSVPFNKPYGLAKSNDDTMIYVSGNSATIYQLSTITFIWSILVPNYNSTEISMSLFVDSCGNRLWALMLGFGIRIYDRISGNELASWNLSTSYPTLYDMVLTSDYELYLIDYSMNQLIHYGSSLSEQCTIDE